ncbi:MAG: TonB-dependent receptor [Bacteroidota bacterium]
MRKSIRVLIIILPFFLSIEAFAQKGIVRGTVIDGATAEPMIGVTVVVEGTTTGGVTDFDGKFQISLDPGTYSVTASFISYRAVTVSEVSVKAGETTLIGQIRLQEDVAQLEDVVVVTAEVIRDSESALLTIKRKSANVLDGISAAKFRKIGDSDAAAAVKRVPGVSIEGSKYVYVRGLGDRYTKTTLNNVDIPGLDPDRNSIQIDIFPTSLIQNMIVSKTALSEMPADFTGGVVNIETIDFPEEKIFNVSLGLSYNPSMHFNSDFVDYEGSNTDWLGFDSDLRELPNGARGDIPTPGVASDQEVLDFSQGFSPVLQSNQENSFMNYNLGASFGNQIELSNSNKLGYIFSLTYKASQTFYDDQEFGEYQVPNQSDENDELIAATIKEGVVGIDSRFLGGLAGLAYKTDRSKFRLTALRLQNGERKTGAFSIIEDPEDDRTAVGKSNYIAPNSQNIEYSERSLTNFLLNGEHYFNGKTWEVDWRISPTISRIEDPDIRVAALTDEFGLSFNPGAGGLPKRIWRFLDEINLVGRVDVTNNLNLFGRDAKLKFGGSYVFKERDYEILEYNLQFDGQPNWESPDLSGVLVDENLYPNFLVNGQPGGASYASAVNFPNSNEYNSSVDNIGIYVSGEFSPLPKLKTIIGLRAENYVQRHTGRDIPGSEAIRALIGTGLSEEEAAEQAKLSGQNVLIDDKVLDELDFFPSLNLTYALTDEQNLRLSYSRTIARPSFKELSFAQILDPISGRTFNGGLFPYNSTNNVWDGNLRPTDIDNIDLRWEIFLGEGQTYSVSAFYKSFQNPIEIVRIPSAQTTNELQPRNVGDSYVYGTEIEFRTPLSLISPTLENFFFNGNVTLTESVLEMSEVEFEGRVSFARDGQTIEDTRDMAGQAPYVINAGISYDDASAGFDAGFFYNVQGRTLSVVGVSLFPDVYTEPFHSLNFNMNKSFGEEQALSINFSVENILNDRREEFFEGFNAQDQIFTGFSPGTTIGIGASYKF